MEDYLMDNEHYDNGVILAVSNSYDKLYYFNEDFDALPEQVQKEIQIMMVMHTEEMGGMLIMGFDVEGKLFIKSKVKEFDGYHDEIGSHLKIKQYQIDKEELFEALQEFYNCFF
jgi:hypothetical protein